MNLRDGDKSYFQPFPDERRGALRKDAQSRNKEPKRGRRPQPHPGNTNTKIAQCTTSLTGENNNHNNNNNDNDDNHNSDNNNDNKNNSERWSGGNESGCSSSVPESHSCPACGRAHCKHV